MTAPPLPATLVVAGLSARLMAEAAARDGYRVVALDRFGDLDTRRASARWLGIGGDGASPRLDPEATLAALDEAAREPGVIGWVAGSDFECHPALLAAGAARLRLLGTAPADVARLRTPSSFFAALEAHALPHPETRLTPPAATSGWLRKLADGTGGWHIRRADDPYPAPPGRTAYWQREVVGTPMSALFVADGRRARLLGCQLLIVRPIGAHPYVFRGAIGPLALPAERMAELDHALQALTATFALRGLGSLDVINEGERFLLLEVNPRPPASLGLYGPGLMRAHVEACLRGRLPTAPPAPDGLLRGSEVVFARRAMQLDDSQADALAARPDCHDLPAAGSHYAPGDPVCTVSARGRSVDALRNTLADKRQALRDGWSRAVPVPAGAA